MFARRIAAAALVACLGIAGPVAAGENIGTFEFKLGEWYELGPKEEPIELHRIRLDRVEGRLTKSALARPHNQQYLQTVRIQLEYTNTSDRKWNARVSASWLDENGDVIDGFSANEALDKRSARKIVQVSLSTLKYGLEKAKTLEVKVHFEP